MIDGKEGAYIPGHITFIDEESIDALGAGQNESFSKRVDEIDRLTRPPMSWTIGGVRYLVSPEVVDQWRALQKIPPAAPKREPLAVIRSLEELQRLLSDARKAGPDRLGVGQEGDQ